MRNQGRTGGVGAAAGLGWVLLGAVVLLGLAQPAAKTSGAIGAVEPTLGLPTLQLQVGPGGGYTLDGRPSSNVAVERALRDARRQSPDLRLRIDAGDDNPERLIAALALAEHAGIRNVGSLMR